MDKGRTKHLSYAHLNSTLMSDNKYIAIEYIESIYVHLVDQIKHVYTDVQVQRNEE